MQALQLNEQLNVQVMNILQMNYETLVKLQKTLFIVSEFDCQLQVQRRDLNIDAHIDTSEWSVLKIKALIDESKYIIQSDTRQKIDTSFTEIVEYCHPVGIAQVNILVIVQFDVRMVEITLMQRGMFINQSL